MFRTLFALLSLSTTSDALALSSDVPLKQLRHTVWQQKDRVPSDQPLDIEQTADGYLWIATYGGLVRFDAQHFERITLPRDPKIQSASASALFAPADGGLWIGFTFGGVAFLKDGKLTAYAAQDGLPMGSVTSFAQGPSCLWMASPLGLARFDASGKWKLDQDGIGPIGNGIHLVFDAGGTLWASSQAGELYTRSPGASAFVRYEPPGAKTIGVVQVIPAPDGSVWLMDDTTARHVGQLASHHFALRNHGAWTQLDADGSMWSTDNGTLVGIHVDSTQQWIGANAVWEKLDTPGHHDAATGVARLFPAGTGQMWLLTSTTLERFSMPAVSALNMNFLASVQSLDFGIGLPHGGGVFETPLSGLLQSAVQGKVSVVRGPLT